MKYKKEASAEENIIRYLLENPENFQSVAEEAPPDIFVTQFNKKVYVSLLNAMKSNENFSISLLNIEFSNDEMGKIIGIEAQNRELTINYEVFAECAEVLKNHKEKSDNISDDDLTSAFNAKKN